MRERFGPGLCLQPCGGSTAGLGCPAGGTAAALTLIAGRRVAKKINNKLVQPIAPFLPGELLEDGGGGGGNSLLLPGPLHGPRGENPTGDGTLPA